MTDLFDYLDWRGDLPFDKIPCCEVDGMILSRLAYLPLETILPPDFSGEVSLKEAAEQLLGREGLALRQARDADLLQRLSQCPRYRSCRLVGARSNLDAESQTQFAALTLQLTEDTCFLAFRGTDNTMVGLKEDFNMSFSFPVPSQKLGLAYLGEAGQTLSGRFYLGGHSKGGNVAVYAASLCPPALQERIVRVYNYDGPGFDGRMLAHTGYAAITGRIDTFVPQSSIIGRLLERAEPYTVVHSSQTGIFQHDLYSWEVTGAGFMCLDRVTGSSRFADVTLRAWLAGMSQSQREQFADGVYQIVTENDLATTQQFREHWLASAKLVVKSARRLDEQTRKNITDALRLLARSAREGARATVRSRREEQTDEQGDKKSLGN